MLLVALGAALPAGARADATQTPVPLAVKVTACMAGPTAEARTAVFRASMPAIDGAERLAVRVELRERPAGARLFRRVRAGSFGSWQRSAPGVGGLVVDKRVEGLHAGSAYRVEVRFRWYGADGAVLRRATRLSALCRQPDRRPDLAVTRIDVLSSGDGSATYRLTVRNTGHGPVVDPFAMTLAVGDLVLRPASPVATLAAGATTTVSLSGPACTPGTPLRAVADSDGEVEEPDERDNVLTRPC